MIIALMLALVEKPMTTWTWLNMLLMPTNVTNNPMEKGIRQQVQNQKLVRESCNFLQETNQTGNVKGVSRIHASNGLIMTIAWSVEGKRSHTLWLFRSLPHIHIEMYHACICCYELSNPKKVSTGGLDYGRESYMR